MGIFFLFVDSAITIYSYALIVYILMSWFPGARDSQFGYFLGQLCEPYLEQFRRFIPPIGMIDISPIAAIFTLQLAKVGLRQLFLMFGV